MTLISREQFLWNFFKNSKGIIPKCYEKVSLDAKKIINKDAAKENSSKLIYISLVPDFFNSKIVNSEKYNLIKINHYGMSGAGMLFDKKHTFETYQKEFLKASYLKTFRRAINRLEKCFNISYEYNYGDISEEKCNYLTKHLKRMLVARFDEKNAESVFMNEWDSNIADLRLLINQKKSSLFVVYDNDTPISISLNRHIDENISFSECHAYNIDYSKFSLGHLDNYLLLNWCLNNNVYFLDLGLGNLDYKSKWCNKFYEIEYHIYYKKKSVLSKLIAYFEVFKIKLKNVIKKLKIDVRLNKFKEKLTKQQPENTEVKYAVETIESPTLLEGFNTMPITYNEGKFTKRILFDFLYSNIENLNDVTVYKSINNENLFLIKGKNKASKIEFTNIKKV